ncbi:MAG TPA: ThuA domain-containing protein [Verrucomicrobiae bacterium]|nr:ThuA domain-containing protein [Verrucomicrobiae bacterium]
MKQFNRREMLVRASLAAASFSLFPSALNAAASPKKRKVLFFSKSSGFEHSVIHRHGGELSFAEKLLQEWGPEQNVEFTFSKDGSLFNPQYLEQFDAYFFVTTGDLTKDGNDKNPPMSPEGKQAFLDAIHNGKGFIGSHCASDTFHSPNYEHADTRYKDDLPGQMDPYIAMLGGEFIIHGAQQKSRIIPIDMHFPGMEGFSEDFGPLEEWYSLKNFAPDLHVILVQDTHGMKGAMYQRPPYPETWARHHGRGRVFYTSMGHREDVWTNPVFKKLLLGGIQWATGNESARIRPNIRKAAPGASQNPSPA